jgi:hypothetical protein
MMNEFLPKVENFPTQISMERSQLEITAAKDRMNATLN